MTACAGWPSTDRFACTPLRGRPISFRKNNSPSSRARRLNIMPNDLLAPEAQVTAHPELLHFLKGRDNPFDLFVAARKPEADFSRYHVSAVHREVFNPLSGIVERYRLAQLTRESDLPRSGVVVVLGVRGMGKTHMVHTLERAGGE